jgi:hypothetical protein
MKSFYKALFMSSSLFAFNATADMYIGGGVYASNVDQSIRGNSLDDDDTVPALFVGWKPVSFLAVEAGYYDLGEYSVTVSDGNAKITGDADAFTVGVVGILPIWIVDVYAKAGFAYVDYELSALQQFTDDGSSTDAYGGVGVNINLGGAVDIYAEYLVFDSEIEVDMLGLGVRLQF